MKYNNALKYKDLSKYNQTIGAVTLDHMKLQLCDYIEAVNGVWYALAYFNDSRKHTEGPQHNGTIVKRLNSSSAANDSGLYVAYVPQKMLGKAIPQYDDENNTQSLINRLSAELSKLNTVRKA
jgi:hypothetical protein